MNLKLDKVLETHALGHFTDKIINRFAKPKNKPKMDKNIGVLRLERIFESPGKWNGRLEEVKPDVDDSDEGIDKENEIENPSIKEKKANVNFQLNTKKILWSKENINV